MNKLMEKLVELLAIVVCKGGNWMILVMACVNVMFFVLCKVAIDRADNMFRPRSDKVNGVNVNMQWDKEQISELKKKRKALIGKYAWYANLTAIFPLLGILGTVAALVTYSSETMMENFMVALSTTLLGVFFAIVFKGIDALLSGPMDVIIGNADYVIQEYERKEAQI